MHMLSLKSICIEDCPKLESFTEGDLASNLKFMRLKNCIQRQSIKLGSTRSSQSVPIKIGVGSNQLREKGEKGHEHNKHAST